MTKHGIRSILWVQGNIPRNYNRQTTENKTSEAAGLQVLPSLISRYPGYCDPVRSSASLSSKKYRCSLTWRTYTKRLPQGSLFVFSFVFFISSSSPLERRIHSYIRAPASGKTPPLPADLPWSSAAAGWHSALLQ